MESDNAIFIGNKPLINYVRSISIQFRKNPGKDIIIKSRGRFISKAVDVVEIAKRNFFEQEGIKIREIITGSEQMTKDDKMTNVSTMDIILVK